MKIRLIVFGFVFAVVCGVTHAGNPEFRGIEVHTWIPGMLSPAEIDETVEWAKEANMNALVMQVRRVGDAYYDSAYEPRATNIKAGLEFDPLDYSIKKARENGLEIHAWINVYRVWASRSKPAEDDHVLNLHPEWLSKDFTGATFAGEGQYLDPGAPGVEEHLVKLVADLMSKYDIDGLMLDYIRYPGKTWGYSDAAVARFNAMYGRTGKPSPNDQLWCRWRRRQVTETVRAIYEEVNRLKPHVKVSAATIPWGPCPSSFVKTDAYAEVFQDWQLWMRQGILDANMPMNYKRPSHPVHSKWFADWLEGFAKWSYGRHTYCTIMVFKGNVAGASEQVRLSREHGLPGVVGFAFSQTSCRAELAPKLRSTVFKEPAPVPPMPWKKGQGDGATGR